MKTTYTILLVLSFLFINDQKAFAQFVVAQDTLRGEINFALRLNDLDNTTKVANDSVFYMLAPDRNTDPWRAVIYFSPYRSIKKGYIDGSKLMRVDDFDIVDVERLSSGGTISFKNEEVKMIISVSNTNKTNLKYQSISVSINGKNILIPKQSYENLPNPDIENTTVYYNKNKQTLYIVANNGDYNSSYYILWVVTPKGVCKPYILNSKYLNE